jgi:hypothetical protein
MVRGRSPDRERRKRTSPGSRTPASQRYRLVRWLFGREAVRESVATHLRLDGSPEQVWDHIMFYEEVPGRPAFFLRTVLPCPLRTEGNKTAVGATVHCTYEGGDLAKRITMVEPSRLLQFDVIEQRLGIEDCILTCGGSYQISACGDRSDVVLITHYQAYLRPRSLWRPLEAGLMRQLHIHILGGIDAAVRARHSGFEPAAVASLTT